MYRKLLLNFASDYRDVAHAIRKALKAEDFEQPHRIVHTLKGVAGNLAARDLQAAAINVERIVRGVGKEAPPSKQLNLSLQTLEAALNQALASIQNLGAPAEKKAGKLSNKEITAITAEIAANIVNRIRDGAEMGDVIQIKSIAEELKSESEAVAP